MGMTFRVDAVGGERDSDASPGSRHHDLGDTRGGSTQEDARLDPMAKPAAGFRARDARLPDHLPGTVHRVELEVTESEHEVAPGVRQTMWTYGGTAPGPVLNGRVGDRFVITLVNRGTIGHSVDFHAGSLAPDRPMRTIAPGESLVYRFTATRAGVWMYHCSSMPMSAHMYDHDPLRVRAGERVRIWVLDAGPNRATSLHVVGGQFDRVWAEGSYRLGSRARPARGSGAQALALAPAQGGFVELTFPEPGRYPVVSHVMVDAERGAHGLFEVTD